jgi:acyl carrier protein
MNAHATNILSEVFPTMPSQEEIFSKVQTALVDALALDEDDVTPDATLQGDLGAESIDYLDIMFKLEKAFNIKIQREELFPEDIFKNAQYVQNGKVTAEGMTLLKKRLPFIDLTKFEANPAVQTFGSMLTVQDMVRYVESKLAA